MYDQHGYAAEGDVGQRAVTRLPGAKGGVSLAAGHGTRRNCTGSAKSDSWAHLASKTRVAQSLIGTLRAGDVSAAMD
jgi:hypothetical protein